MCEFCEKSQEEKDRYYDWANCDPYVGDEQVEIESINCLLDNNFFVLMLNLTVVTLEILE